MKSEKVRQSVLYESEDEGNLSSESKKSEESDDDGNATGLKVVLDDRAHQQYQAFPKTSTTKDNWFLGKISREQAEEILIGNGEVSQNTFLVRESSREGYFALSLYDFTSHAYTHWVIAPVSNAFTIENCELDSNLYYSL